MDSQRQYIAIDLKSFYASVECVARGLDPLDTCLVVADPNRTEKTICLAVSPALKAYGLGGRPRLFEVVQRVREVNRTRGRAAKSSSKTILDSHPDTAVDSETLSTAPAAATATTPFSNCSSITLTRSATEPISRSISGLQSLIRAISIKILFCGAYLICPDSSEKMRI